MKKVYETPHYILFSADYPVFLHLKLLSYPYIIIQFGIVWCVKVAWKKFFSLEL